jgi:hypothetical protein
VERNISPEIFFDALLSDQDLSKLLCTCRSMKEMILKWKTIFPIQKFNIKRSMTDEMLGNFLMNYSHNIKKLNFLFFYGKEFSVTIDGLQHLALLHSSLLELTFVDCFKNGLRVISSLLPNLTSITICDSSSVTSGDLDSLSKLTNLEVDYSIRS